MHAQDELRISNNVRKQNFELFKHIYHGGSVSLHCFTRANEVCLELVMYFLLYIHHGIVILTATSSLVLTDKCSAGTHNDLITSK